MSERVMRSRLHMDGGGTVDVSEAILCPVTGLGIIMMMEHGEGSAILLSGVDGAVMVPKSRIVWVSTLQGGSNDG